MELNKYKKDIIAFFRDGVPEKPTEKHWEELVSDIHTVYCENYMPLTATLLIGPIKQCSCCGTRYRIERCPWCDR